MYKVKYDNETLYDPRVDELALINPVVTLEENKAGSFSFTIAPKHPAYGKLQRRKTVISVFNDDTLVFCGVPVSVTEDFLKKQKIVCEGELTYLNDSIQRQARYQNATVRGLFETYINNHNEQVEDSKKFEVGVVTVTDPNDSLYRYTNMQSTMTELKEDFVDDLGGIVRVRHTDGKRYLDYLADSPNTCSQVIKLGKNLTDYTSNIDSSDIATAIIPLGAKLDTPAVEGLETRLDIKSVNNSLDYVFNQTAIDTFGWIYKTVEWDDVTTPEALKSKGEKYLADIQYENIVIEAKAVDLHWTNDQIEQFKLSDQIRVVSEPHGLDRYFRLTKQTLNLNAPENDTITLGQEEKLTLSARSNQASEAIKKAMESITPASSILKQAKDNATQLLTSAMGGYVYKTQSELYIMDTNDPDTAQKMWRWNINGLGYSSTGVNGPYGVAMTMDGAIVADFITTGLLKAIEIKNGNGFAVTKEGKMTATAGSIAGWNIGSQAIYKDVIVGSTVYRVYLQPPLASAPNKTWVLSIQKSTDSGKNFSGIFVLYSDGSVSLGSGNITIDANGNFSTAGNRINIYGSTGAASFANGDIQMNVIDNKGKLFVKDQSGDGHYGFTGSKTIGGETLNFANGILY